MDETFQEQPVLTFEPFADEPSASLQKAEPAQAPTEAPGVRREQPVAGRAQNGGRFCRKDRIEQFQYDLAIRRRAPRKRWRTSRRMR